MLCADVFSLVVRMNLYEKRKSYLEHKLQKEVNRLVNRARFCGMVANGHLKVGNRSRKDILSELETLGFIKEEQEVDAKELAKKVSVVGASSAEAIEGEEEVEGAATSTATSAAASEKGSSPFDYLLNTPLWNLTQEKIDRLNAERDVKEKELKVLRATTPSQMWVTELQELKKELQRIYNSTKNQL
jgi:DNA topoisomerase-2